MANPRVDGVARANLNVGAAAALLLALNACHATPQVRLKPDATTAPPALPALVKDIDAILADPALAHGYWGVVIRSLKNDETLYSLNARKLMMPASNMKIVTLAAAAERLGWNYTYDTWIFGTGPIANGVNGVLDGDLLIVGSGDPGIGTIDDMSDRLFANWAERLKSAGIRTIAGRVIGDDNAFDDAELGFGWSWDDLQDDYAAGISALQFNENMARVMVGPGPAAGTSAAVSIAPAYSGLTIDSAVTTVAEGAAASASINVSRLPGRSTLALRGTIALGSAPRALDVSVDNPTLFFVNTLRAALIANGIDVRGPAVDIDELPSAPPHPASPPLIAYTSPRLSVLAMRLMKISQNQYAETFLKTMGAALGTPTAAAGRAAVQTTLQAWGVQPADLIQRDGSGLSRYDYVTPDALATILTHVYRDDRLRRPFEASLPIAGRDGGLTNRMKGTPAEGNARAKTGSMTDVRGLSGFVTTADGEPLVFSILANNFDAPPAAITATMDAIVVRLARFSRRGATEAQRDK
ncbi:MAG: D-alanyl-D-alanine carboxypeptidase/D-alanyl-D-alanine-endopeptidase [Acidobacteria bacterium]|nr:D-alanyl-D-alanine carboxypeptidase/D-alanyl-D-alanine-endopeptidase [Acidobacteriota bacterium]